MRLLSVSDVGVDGEALADADDVRGLDVVPLGDLHVVDTESGAEAAQLRIWNLAVTDEVQSSMSSELAAREKRIAKYMEKYKTSP